MDEAGKNHTILVILKKEEFVFIIKSIYLLLNEMIFALKTIA